MQGSNFESDSDIQDQIKYYLRFWPWFVFGVFVCLMGGLIYLRYTTEMYQAKASVIIKDTQSGGGLSEAGVLGELDVLGNSFNTVENEIEILHSKRLMKNVVKRLHLNIRYVKTGNFKDSDIYSSSPISVVVLNDSTLLNLSKTIQFNLLPVDRNSFKIRSPESESYSVFEYGSSFQYRGLEINITPNNDGFSMPKASKEEIQIIIDPLQETVRRYNSRLFIEKSDRRGSVVILSINDQVRQRAEDILNELIVEYNQDAIADKNQVAKNTANFIDERLAEVQTDLDSIEQGIESFKDSKNLTDLTAESMLSLQESTGLGREAVVAETKLKVARNILSKLQGSEFQIIPQNAGLEDFDFNAQTSKYNVLLLRYQELLKRGTEENPALIRLKSELEALKSSMIASLQTYITQLEIEQNSVLRELGQVRGKLSGVPENERVNRDIERTRRVVEAIYVLLSEKRETTAISLAITAPKAKVVDFAFAPASPIAPQPKTTLIICLLIGLFVPFSVIYLQKLFNNKLESRRDVQKSLPNLAILGEIPRLDSGDEERIGKNDRSVLAESFRILRTNLQFKLSALSKERSPLIMITSTVKGEGKTFIAFNLAATLAFSGKKVLLIGGDIRNPQIHRYLENHKRNEIGVTEFLTQPEVEFSEIVHKIGEIPNLEIALSGAIPPNPAELWMQPRTKDLFKQAREQYDIVLVDTAPTMLVTDTLLINHLADISIFVCRANYTEKELLEYVKEITESEKIRNAAMVINSVKLANFGYGNKYGYSYAADKESAWTRFLNKFRTTNSDF